jgi:hypothetical protein
MKRRKNAREIRTDLRSLLEHHPLFVLCALAITAYCSGCATVIFIQRTEQLVMITPLELQQYQNDDKKYADLQQHYDEDLGRLEPDLRSQITKLQSDLAAAQSQLTPLLQQVLDEQHRVNTILQNAGAIYRVPGEPTVWLIQGGHRLALHSEAELRQRTGLHSSQAIADALILRIPIQGE